MDDGMRRMLRPRPEVQDRHEFRQRVDHHPQPKHVGALAQPRAQFIKLEMRELEAAEPTVMQRRAVPASPREPGGDRPGAVPKHPHSCGDRKSLSYRAQDFCDTGGGRLEAIEGCAAPGGKGYSTRLTAKGLDALVRAVRPITGKGMDLGIGNAVLGTRGVGAGKAVGKQCAWACHVGACIHARVEPMEEVQIP